MCRLLFNPSVADESALRLCNMFGAKRRPFVYHASLLLVHERDAGAAGAFLHDEAPKKGSRSQGYSLD